ESEAKKLAEERAGMMAADLERLNAANALIESGRFLADFADWAKAEGEFNKAVELREGNSHAWTARAEFYLNLGLWDLAAADFGRAFQHQLPVSSNYWFRHALLRLFIGDVDGYRRRCRQMFERFEGTQNPQFAHNMASALCLVSDPVVDRAKLVQLAERGLSVRRTPWRLATLATAYCRSGDYKKAVDRLL